MSIRTLRRDLMQNGLDVAFQWNIMARKHNATQKTAQLTKANGYPTSLRVFVVRLQQKRKIEHGGDGTVFVNKDAYVIIRSKPSDILRSLGCASVEQHL